MRLSGQIPHSNNWFIFVFVTTRKQWQLFKIWQKHYKLHTLNLYLQYLIELLFDQAIIVTMAQKFTFEQYEISIYFKTDNFMSASAQHLPTGELFKNDSIELMRIKKDTVQATLNKKSNSLRCEIEQFIDKDSKYLMIKFIVSFDFLPEFSQQVQLPLIEKSESINNMQLKNLKHDMDELQAVINSIEKNGIVNISEMNSFGNEQIKSFELARGNYLLRIVGTFNNSSSAGVMQTRDIIIGTQVVGDKKIQNKLVVPSTQGSSFPFNFSRLIQIAQNEGKLNIQMYGVSHGESLTNIQITICPTSDLRR